MACNIMGPGGPMAYGDPMRLGAQVPATPWALATPPAPTTKYRLRRPCGGPADPMDCGDRMSSRNEISANCGPPF